MFELIINMILTFYVFLIYEEKFYKKDFLCNMHKENAENNPLIAQIYASNDLQSIR